MSNPEYTKHKVATDALETLGMLIPDNSGRDAIHLAVEPVVCGPRPLMPGQRIKLAVGDLIKGHAIPAQVTAVDQCGEHMDDATGIVDPFLTYPVKPGQRFWFVVLPRTITSLRHVWSHPDFPEEAASAYHEDKEDDHYFGSDPKERAKAMASAWLKDHIANDETLRGLTVDELIEAATNFLDHGDYFYGPKGNTFTGGEYLPDEFWERYEAVTGRSVPHDARESFFVCSC